VNLTHAPTRQIPYPRWFFPGTETPSAAASIEFTGRAESRIVDLILPESAKERVLEGFVSMADGPPGRLIQMFLVDSFGALVLGERADPYGHFSLRVFAGVAYKLHAIWLGRASTEAISAVPADIPAGSGSMTLRLIVDQPGSSLHKR